MKANEDWEWLTVILCSMAMVTMIWGFGFYMHGKPSYKAVVTEPGIVEVTTKLYWPDGRIDVVTKEVVFAPEAEVK